MLLFCETSLKVSNDSCNPLRPHWSINQRMMIAGMAGVVATPLLCRQITSELWHHCLRLSRSLSLSLFLSPCLALYLVFCCRVCSVRHRSIPSLVWSRNKEEMEWEKKRERGRESWDAWMKENLGGGGIKVKAREENGEVEAMTMEGDRLRETGSRRRWREGRDGAKQRERREGRGWAELQRENCAPRPQIFIHQRSTYGTCLSVSVWMHGRSAGCV